MFIYFLSYTVVTEVSNCTDLAHQRGLTKTL